MALSPPPLAANGRLNHHSHSPLLQQPISKREKRKNNMEDRFQQINRDFNDNRDFYYRKQVQTFQADIDYIRNADLYHDQPLQDSWDDPIDEASTSVLSTRGSLKAENQNGSPRIDHPHKIGAYTAKFVHKINDAMEERDADLVTVVYRYNSRINEIQRDVEFNVAVAHQEHQRLVESLRRRLIVNLNQKKAALQKEKDKLDIADSNALLYHPNQFSLAASPGGPQSNRKTRHTRHRLEVDDMDATSNNHRRKRKGPADADNGSPAPTGREVEPVNPMKEANTKLEYHQTTVPQYSLDRLFSQRELDQNLQLSTFEVIEDFKRRKLDKGSRTNLNSLVGTDFDGSDSDENADAGAEADGVAEDVFLAAPEMERNLTNASQHLTRSTRTLNPKRTSGLESLGYLAGRASGAACIGSLGQKEKRREDEYQRAAALTEQEQDDDLAMMKTLMEDEEAGKNNQLLLDEAVDDMEEFVDLEMNGDDGTEVED